MQILTESQRLFKATDKERKRLPKAVNFVVLKNTRKKITIQYLQKLIAIFLSIFTHFTYFNSHNNNNNFNYLFLFINIINNN